MSTRATTNVRENYFEHKDLSRIVGEPVFESLHHMLLQVKANLSSVPSTLGGGAHGYAGAILSVTTYATLAPTTPFITPVHPGILTVPAGATQYAIAFAKTQHDELMRVFSEYQLVQRATIQQVLEAINPKYVKRLRNRITGQVPTDIRLLMMSLFAIYGRISANNLKEKYDSVATMSYDINEPISLIFDAVDDLREIAELAIRPYSNQQMVDLGYIVVSRQPIFRSDIRRWLRREPVDQTWQDFQDVFTTAHQELRETESSMEEMGYQSANAMASQMANQVIEELRAEMHERAPAVDHSPPPAPPPPTTPPATPLALATGIPQDQNMMAMLATMQANMEQMRLQMNAQNQYQQPWYDHSGRGRGRGRGYDGRRNYAGYGRGRGRGDGTTRRRAGFYCHTHGNCAHNGADCQAPSAAHKTTATFTNMMGGSTRNCE